MKSFAMSRLRLDSEKPYLSLYSSYTTLRKIRISRLVALKSGGAGIQPCLLAQRGC
jgi:hypothetical protein